MKKGKFIIIEGTDCSGKETQSNLLKEKLEIAGYKVFKGSFPNYDSPTGKIIGGPYLGKDYICDGWFKEGAASVDPLVASCYFAADRRYNIGVIKNYIDKGYIVIYDRYVESNMAHQGGKLTKKEDRLKMYEKLDTLEFGILELPKPDAVLFLYMPYEYAEILKKNRKEKPDQHENNKEHLINAENSYLELCDIYGFKKINCINNKEIKTIEEINNELYNTVLEML